MTLHDLVDERGQAVERGRAEGMEEGHGFGARAGFDRLMLAPGDHYLDIGCGNGYTVRWASDVVGDEGHAVGIDLSPNMIDRAREASAGRANVQFHVAAFPDHVLPRTAFDGIFSMEVLYYLPDLKGALEACDFRLNLGFGYGVFHYLRLATVETKQARTRVGRGSGCPSRDNRLRWQPPMQA